MPRGLGKEEGKASRVLKKYAKKWISVLEELEEAEKERKKAEAKKRDVQRQFADAMMGEGISSFKIEGLGGFRTQVEVYPNIKNKELVASYIKKRKTLKFLYSVRIDGNRFKCWIKELMEQGKPIPPGIDPYKETQIRRY